MESTGLNSHPLLSPEASDELPNVSEPPGLAL